MSKKPVKRLHVNGVEYTYIVSRGATVKIRQGGKTVVVVDPEELFGMDSYSVERGLRKRWLGVTPAVVKRWLEVYLKVKALFSIWPGSYPYLTRGNAHHPLKEEHIEGPWNVK